MCRPLDNAIVRTDSRRLDSLAWHPTRAGLSNRQTVARSTVEAAVLLERCPRSYHPRGALYEHPPGLDQPRQVRQRTRTDQHTKKSFARRGGNRSEERRGG